MATIQAKRAIQALLKAGYKRDEFSVRTKIHRLGSGRGQYEYGDPTIIVWADKERQMELAPKVVEQGIGVQIDVECSTGRVFYPHYIPDAQDPKIEYRKIGVLKNDSL